MKSKRLHAILRIVILMDFYILQHKDVNFLDSFIISFILLFLKTSVLDDLLKKTHKKVLIMFGG